MKRLFLVLVAAVLVLGGSRPTSAGSVEILTELKFIVTDPPGTTVSGFTLSYNTTEITDLKLVSGPITSFSTDGVSTVDATFSPRSAALVDWTFFTSDAFPIARLAFDLTGESATITGGILDIAIIPIPEPSSVVLLGSGLLGCVLWRRKRSSQ